MRATAPDFVHDAATDRRDPVSAVEAETTLDLRMETIEVRPESAPVDRGHDVDTGGRRLQRAAEGVDCSTRRSTIARHATAMLSVSGLNAPRNRSGARTATPTVLPSAQASAAMASSGVAEPRRSAAANATSRMPRLLTSNAAVSTGSPPLTRTAVSTASGARSFGTRPCTQRQRPVRRVQPRGRSRIATMPGAGRHPRARGVAGRSSRLSPTP
jgi:hypothetical protein